MSYYIAVDLGTTGCRSILFDRSLNVISSDYEEYLLITPKENYAEQDAEVWIEIALRTLGNAIKKSGIERTEIESISVSSQGITVVPVNKEFKPLYNAITWLDTRAETEAEQIRKDFGDEKIFRITGKPISSAYTLPKLLWIKRNLPEVYHNTYKFLMPMDYIIAKLSGTCVTDYSMASGTLFFDLKKGCWSKEITEFYGIDNDMLPEFAESGSKAGCILPEIAEKLGLKKDCIVAVGAQDQKCAACGVGLSNNVMTVSLGTAAAITRLLENADTSVGKGFGLCGYIDKNSFVAEGVISTAGTCLRWVRDILFKGEDYGVIDKEAKAAKERGSSVLFFPYLAGASSPDYYSESTGVFYGMSLATTRGDLALAVMEGVAFQLRTILYVMGAYGNTDTLILFGGGAKSEFWSSVIADITGMRISVPKSFEAAGAGAAMLAAKSVGIELKPLGTKRVYLPDNSSGYNKKYSRFKDIEKRIWEQN